MIKNEKAPEVGGTTPEASAHGGLAGYAAHGNNTTSIGVIASVLRHGEENALSAPQLAALLGLSDTRAVRKLVEHERRDGSVILSTWRGYFLPSKDADQAEKELLRFVRAMGRRLSTNRACVDSAKEALVKITHRNQLELEEAVGDG